MTSGRNETLDAALRALDLTGARLEASETRATDTEVWRVRHEGRSLAVRVFRETQQRVMQREREAMELARSQGIPAPEVIATALIDGKRPAMAVEWISGETIGDVLLRQPVRARRLGREAGRLLGQIHAIQVSHSTSESTWIEWGIRDDSDLRRKLESVITGPPSLIHLDFHPFNLIANGGTVAGVLDWTNTSFGDPRADVARTVSIMHLVAPAFMGTRGAGRMTGGMFTRGFLSGYREMRPDLSDMAPFYAWAGKVILVDLGPKLHMLPVQRPERLSRVIEGWTERWRTRALGH